MSLNLLRYRDLGCVFAASSTSEPSFPLGLRAFEQIFHNQIS